VDKKPSSPSPHAVELWVDSGAYGAWRASTEIDLNRYIEFLKESGDLIAHYVNLDRIPGRPNRKPLLCDTEECAEVSYLNQQRMKKAGLNPIPVVHRDDPFEYLEWYLEDGERYIGLSFQRRSGLLVNSHWFDRCFELLAQYPHVKVHGFGITDWELLRRYPFTSVDSTTWARLAGNGIILVPHPDEYERPIQIIFTDVPPNGSTGRRFEDEGEAMKSYVRAYLNQIGINPAECRYDDNVRRRVNALLFQKLGERLDKKIVFASSPTSHSFPETLKSIGARDQLLSYNDLRNMPRARELLQTFVATGLYPARKFKKRIPRTDYENPHYIRFRKRALLERIRMYKTLDEFGDPIKE